MAKIVSKSMQGGYGKWLFEGRAPSSWSRAFLFLFLALALFLLWSPALRGGFVFDDELLVLRNPLVTGRLDLVGIFGGPYLGAAAGQEAVPYWRPLTVFVFWCLWHLGNGAALAFHAFALLLQLGGAVLGMSFFLRWGLAPGLSLLAALAFAAHPSQVEGVAWVSAMGWPLMAFFLLVFLLAWGKHRIGGGGKWLAVALLAFGLALLAQEAAILGLLLALLLEAFPLGGKEREGGAGKGLAALFILALLWFVTRQLVLRHAAFPVGGSSRGAWESFVLRLHILGIHLRELVLPGAPDVLRPLPEHLFGPGSGLGVSLAWAGGFLALLLGILAFWRRGRTLARGLLWVGACLAPLLLVGEGTGVTPLADRYHAFASLGLVLFVADMGARLGGSLLGGLLLLGLCLFYTPKAREGVRPWRDPRSFWEHASLQNPDSVLAAYSLGRQRLMDYEKGGRVRDLEGAGEALDRALALRRSFGIRGKAERNQELAIETAKAWVSLTRAMRSKRVSLPGARAAFERILEKAPRRVEALVGLGVALVLEGRVEEAEKALRRAVSLDPNNPQARFNLARLLDSRGERMEAERQLREVLRIQPGNRGARALLRRLKGW